MFSDNLAMFRSHFFLTTNYMFCIILSLLTLNYWVGVQRDKSYLTGRRCLFSLGWLPLATFLVMVSQKKKFYGVDVLHHPASHPIFSYWVG